VNFLFSKSTEIKCPGSDCDWKNARELDKHFNKIADIIDALDPDIINLCEVNKLDVLTKLKDSLDGPTKYKCFISKTKPPTLDQNIGLITSIDPVNFYRTDMTSSFPLKNSPCKCDISGVVNLPKHYISTFHINGINIVIIGVHLKASPYKSENCCIREAQAMIIQKIIVEKYNDTTEIMVIGDFNDYDDDIKDSMNNVAKSNVLDIVKGEDGHNPINYKLVNVSKFINKHNRYTSVNNDNKPSMIDHVLVSERLLKYVTYVDIYKKYDGQLGEDFNSDHYPVVVDFDFSL
jgi:exonuclease III